MDITATAAVDLQARSTLMKVMDPSSWFRWKCNDVGALRECGARVEHTVSMANLPADIRRVLSPGMRLLFGLMSGGYGIYRFSLFAPSPAR